LGAFKVSQGVDRRIIVVVLVVVVVVVVRALKLTMSSPEADGGEQEGVEGKNNVAMTQIGSTTAYTHFQHRHPSHWWRT
jgi:uncharacterized membrane protein